MRLVQTSWSSFWMVQHASSSTISGLCFRSTSTQRPSTRTDGCSYHLVVVLPCHRPSHPLRSSTMCFLLPSDACLPTPTLHSPRSPSSPSSRPSRTFLHGFHSRPRTVPFLFPAFPSAWTECVEDDVPWFRSVSFVSIRFHTTDRTRATRGRPVPISSDHVLFVSPPKTDPIGSIGRSDEAKPRGRRRRFCTDEDEDDGHTCACGAPSRRASVHATRPCEGQGGGGRHGGTALGRTRGTDADAARKGSQRSHETTSPSTRQGACADDGASSTRKKNR